MRQYFMQIFLKIRPIRIREHLYHWYAKIFGNIFTNGHSREFAVELYTRTNLCAIKEIRPRDSCRRQIFKKKKKKSPFSYMRNEFAAIRTRRRRV